MGTWTKYEEQRYFNAIACKERRDRHRRMIAVTSIVFGIAAGLGLLLQALLRQ
jgi:hypothetical protein